MIAALVVVSLYAVAITLLWRSSASSVRKLFDRCSRSDGQFMAADAALNELRVKHGQTLMELEDALRTAIKPGRN